MNRLAPQKLIISLIALLLAAFVIAIISGPTSIPLSDLAALVSSSAASDNSQHTIIITQLRLPRALLAILVGAGLAVSGAAMQGLFRNPLADPSLVGVSSGAMVGASLMIVAGGSWLSSSSSLSLGTVAIGAFLGGVFAAILVYRLATSPNGTSVSTMLLAGIAITALAGALNHLLEFYTSNDMLRQISLWKMGGLDSANWVRVQVAAVVLIPVTILLCRYSKPLNALLLGESEARHLGISVERVKRQLIFLVALGVGTAVALTGLIAFVGLVIPHIVRLLIGPNHRYLLPASALAGAILLLLADAVARVVIAPTELPVGVVTSILGAPFFISLLRHRREYGME
ncbi:MAG: iron ABC transporter permease [Spongiibacteraceae bacterium]